MCFRHAHLPSLCPEEGLGFVFFFKSFISKIVYILKGQRQESIGLQVSRLHLSILKEKKNNYPSQAEGVEGGLEWRVFNYQDSSQAWQYSPLIPTLRRQRQVDFRV